MKTVKFALRLSDSKNQADESIELNQSNASFNPLKSILKNSHSSNDLIPIDQSGLLCSGRGILVTFIIIVLIILSAAIAVGIVFNDIKSDSTKSEKTNNEVSLSATLASVVTSTISIGSQTGAPCSSYTTINDPTRNINYKGGSACDRVSLFNATDGGSWIRFIGTGGTTIPTTPIIKAACGAYVPGWHNGTLPPNVGDIVNGTICFSVDYILCISTLGTTIVNCGGFYIYLLLPSAICSSRYCTI